MNKPLNIFVGYDTREPLAYHVACHSILSRSSIPVSFTPLVQDTLRLIGLYTREANSMESTQFAFSRFLVPFLSGYNGISIFMDCDMLCLGDIADAVEGLEPWKYDWSVAVCQHDYCPKQDTKFLGAGQTAYPRKNWSSFIVFNNAQCRALKPAFVNTATGLELHRFLWTQDEKVKPLDLKWNWLAGEYDPNPEAAIIHYTNGGPWFEESKGVDHADDWQDELRVMIGGAHGVHT